MKHLINLVLEAGKIALSEQTNMTVQRKNDGSIVTNGDLKVSNFLESELKKLYPDFEIFSEENCQNIPQGNKIIVIDPIDGTQSYARKQDTWTVLIGFLEDGIISQGLVYQPTTDKIYYASKGQGAFLKTSNQTIKINSLRNGKLKSFVSPNKKEELEFLQRHHVGEIDFMYSASLKIMEIAQGNCDLTPNFRKKCSLWDLVAPLIILQEAGGDIVFETTSTLPIDFANPHIDINFYAVGARLKNQNLFKP